MVNGIKMLKLSRDTFRQRHGRDMEEVYGDEIAALVKRGRLELDDKELRVPRQYFIYADDICRDFFLPEHSTMMTSQMLRSKIVKETPEHEAAPVA